MDLLSGEKGDAESKTGGRSVISLEKPESVMIEQMTNSAKSGGDCERNSMISVSQEKGNEDILQASTLLSQKFGVNGSAKSVVGLGEKNNPGNGNANEDVTGSNPTKDKNSPRPFGLFPNHAGIRSLEPSCGTEQKQFARAAIYPWLLRGAMPPSSPAYCSVAASSPTTKRPTAQLTIFYAGMVNVFDDVPADKAQAIMLLADSGNSASNIMKPAQQIPINSFISAPANSAPRASLSPSARGNKEVSIPTLPLPGRPNQNQPSRLQSDLPIARKQSLQRFLEKRKDRLSSKAPYMEEHRSPAPALHSS